MLYITRKIYDNIYYDECFILWFIIYNNFNESLRIILLIYNKIYYLYMRNKNLRKSIQNICIEARYKI